MSTVFTPTWTDNVTVLAPYAVIKSDSYRVVTGLDLRVKKGGMLKIGIACGGNTPLTAGGALYAKVYRTLNNDGANPMNGALHACLSQTVLGAALLSAAQNAGAVSMAYDGAVGTAFAAENIIFFWAVATTVPAASGALNAGAEFLQLSKGAATPMLFNTPSKYSHVDNELVSLGSAMDIWLPGGSAYALVVDHLFDALGDAMACAAYIQTYDSDLGT